MLESQIDLLSAAITPRTDTPARQARFDQQLFSNHGTRLRDYLLEIKKSMERLKQVIAENHLLKISFISEKLILQISALQRELATESLREADPSHDTENSHLYPNLARCQDYERRIIVMIHDRENKLGNQTHLSEQRQIQRELAALEGRLMRCRQALTEIERAIERKKNSF
jgi:primosomal replication protein N''